MRIAIGLGMAALFLTASGCGRKEAIEAQPLRLFFTCDTSGRIEPCGCFTGQYGGLTRVNTVLKSFTGDSLKVEVGNAIAGLEDYEVLQFKHLLGACAAMGYSAVNLGEREARLPAATLRDLAADSPAPLVSANVLDAESGETLAAPSVVVDFGSIRIGIIGAVDPKSVKGQPGDGVRIAGMQESIGKEIAALGKEADVLVCLAFTDENGLEEIARKFFELDFILGGDVRQPSPAIRQVNRSWILATTNQARALGEIEAIYDPEAGKLTDVHGDISLMVDSIPQDRAIRQFSIDYRKEVGKTKLKIDQPALLDPDRIPGVKPPATYVGSMTCAGCHVDDHKTWAQSGHARAFEVLERKKSQNDPGCIGCHVVGFGEPGGYLRGTENHHLEGVGCESCHGPGSEHVRVRSEAAKGSEVLLKMRPVGKGQCIQCHYGEFSRPFDWDTFWPPVSHGKPAP